MLIENSVDGQRPSLQFQLIENSVDGQRPPLQFQLPGIVTRNSETFSAAGRTRRSSNSAGTRKKSPGLKFDPAHSIPPVRQTTIAKLPRGAISRSFSKRHFSIWKNGCRT